jgi:predicted enzyme related to lactoylglutathione lyase
MGGIPYVLWEQRGATIAGMMPMIGDGWPVDLAPHWMIYFAVEDCDAVAARAISLGGRVPVPPTNFPMGRFAEITDPQGGTFSILTGNH